MISFTANWPQPAFISVPLLHLTVTINGADSKDDKNDSIFSISGSITQKKLEKSIDEIGIDKIQLNIDMGRSDINKMIQLSSFLAGGAGARGTPTFFINEEFVPGYVSSQQIKSLLK